MSKFIRSLAELKEGMRLALLAVRANKFRSIMTIFGVMIGVAAVILVSTIMDGFNEYLLSSIDKIGKNVMYVDKWGPGVDFDNLTEEDRRRPEIRMKEAAAIEEYCSLVSAVSAEKRAFDNIAKYEDKKIRNPDDFRGCWPALAEVTARDCEFGRFIDDNDMRRGSMVCVIGPEVADALFADRAGAVGKEIRVNGWRFEVIGVQEYIDDFFGISENDYIYIPMTTFDRLYPGVEECELMVSAISRMHFTEAYDEVVNALRRVRQLRPEDDNNFGIYTQDRFKNQVGDLTGQIKLWGVAIAAVGLIVGVIGVMNIMLVAVTQRTREIGVRKAVGAKRSNIMFQFLVEAATLTLLGGAVGILVGALGGFGLTAALEWRYYLSPMWTLLGMSMSVGTGVIAGLYPAWRAARVDPIVALRYE